MKDRFKYIISGALAGGANGIFGSGGGMFLVPLFCRWIKLPEEKALATSLAVVLPVSIVSGVVYLLRGSFEFSKALPFLVGGVIGGVIGGTVFKKLSPMLLRKALALFIIYGGIRALFAI